MGDLLLKHSNIIGFYFDINIPDVTIRKATFSTG